MAQTTINASRCKGCGHCVSVCPKKIIRLSASLNEKGYHPAEVFEMPSCIACAFCATICPDAAITVEK